MKIKSGQLTPDTLPHLLRNVVYRATPDGVVIQSRPRPPVNGWSLLQKQYRTRFAFAARMASSAVYLDLETAREMSKGTEQTPRDILTMACLGQYYFFQFPDGSESGHVPGPIYPKPVTPDTEFDEMHWATQNNIFSTSYSSSPNATKGLLLNAIEAQTIKSVAAVINTVAGASYDFHIGTIDGSNKIATIASAQANKRLSSGQQYLWANLDFEVSIGENFFLMIGRTDSTDTYVLPIAYVSGDQWLWSVGSVNAALIPKANPSIGDTVTLSAYFQAPLAFI